MPGQAEAIQSILADLHGLYSAAATEGGVDDTLKQLGAALVALDGEALAVVPEGAKGVGLTFQQWSKDALDVATGFATYLSETEGLSARSEAIRAQLAKMVTGSSTLMYVIGAAAVIGLGVYAYQQKPKKRLSDMPDFEPEDALDGIEEDKEEEEEPIYPRSRLAGRCSARK